MNKILSFIFILLLSIHYSYSADLTFASEDSWPPFSRSDGKGISTTLIQKAFSSLNIRPKFKVFPYARVLSMTKSGEVDGCYNVTRQKSTEELFHFGNEPLMKVSASFFYKKGKKFYKSFKDLPAGLKIGLITGYEYGDQYERHRHKFKEERVSSQRQIIRMLISERIDAAIMFDQVAVYQQVENKLVGYLEKGFENHSSDIYVAFSKKDIEKSKKYARLLDQGIRNIKKSGVYKKIISGKIK